MSASLSFLGALAERARIVSSDEVAETAASLGYSRLASNKMVSRLADAGWLRRLQRGTYLVAAPGLPPLHPFVIGTALASPSAVSGWAALNHHGLTEQIPRTIEISTTSTSALRTAPVEQGRHVLALDDERFQVVHVVARRFFGYDDVWFDTERARVFDRERAVLDLFVRPGDFGGIQTAFQVLEEHELRRERLVDHALKLGTIAVAKRLGFVLEQTGSDEALWRPLLELPAKHHALLDPSLPDQGPHRTRWNLRENLSP